MRSLIKMEMNRYPVFSYRDPTTSQKSQKRSREETIIYPVSCRYIDEISEKRATKKQQNRSLASRQLQTLDSQMIEKKNYQFKRQNVQSVLQRRKDYRVSRLLGKPMEEQPILSLSPCEKPGTPIPKFTCQQSIEKYVNNLAEQLQEYKGPAKQGENKLKLLKRILEHCDIKQMRKPDYSRLIKTFGLRIQAFNADLRKPIPKRHFTIKPQTSLTRNRNTTVQTPQNDQTQQFSTQLAKTNQRSGQKNQKAFFSMRFKNNEKQKNQKLRQSPLKYKDERGSVQAKVNKYRQFLFALNLANNVFVNLDIPYYEQPLKFFIGKGNNGNLIKSIMKKRFWFEEVKTANQANFIWTQIKVQSVYNRQQEIGLKEFTNQQGMKTHTQTTNFSTNNNKRGRFPVKRFTETDFNDPFLRILTMQQESQLKKVNQNFKLRCKSGFEQKSKMIHTKRKIDPKEDQGLNEVVHNHLISNGLLGNKKAMFYMLREYYRLIGKNIFDTVPLTFHIKRGVEDEQFKAFVQCYQQRKKKKLSNFWIMKPGEFTNQGNGIKCAHKLQEIRKRVSQCRQNSKQIRKQTNRQNGKFKRSLILQLYITNPLLYNGRKFDFRMYCMITCRNGKIRAYWYQQGYIRTASYFWSLEDMYDNQVHLTNDAIQKHSEHYGRYEPANKISFNQLQRYLETLPQNGRNMDVRSNLIPEMKKMATDAIKATSLFVDPNRKQSNFEIFGLDFMVDDNLKPWLIEINTNPCLQLCCPLLSRILPNMIENAFRIGLDTVFPPPTAHPSTHRYNIPENALHYNKFELIFDEQKQAALLRQLYRDSNIVQQIGDQEQDKQQYAQEGDILQLQQL